MLPNNKTYYKKISIEDSELSENLQFIENDIRELENSLGIKPNSTIAHDTQTLNIRLNLIQNIINANKPDTVYKPTQPQEPQQFHTTTVYQGRGDDYDAEGEVKEVENYYYASQMEDYRKKKLPEYEADSQTYRIYEENYNKWNNQTINYKNQTLNKEQQLKAVQNINALLTRIKFDTEELYTYNGITNELNNLLKIKTDRGQNIKSISDKINNLTNENDTDKIYKIAGILIQEYLIIKSENSRLSKAIFNFIRSKLYIPLPYDYNDAKKINLNVPTALDLAVNPNANAGFEKFYAITNQYRAYTENLEHAKLINEDIKNAFITSVKEISKSKIWDTYNPRTFKSNIPTGAQDIGKINIEQNSDAILKEMQAIARTGLHDQFDLFPHAQKTLEFYQAIASLDIVKLQNFANNANLNLPIQKINPPKSSNIQTPY